MNFKLKHALIDHGEPAYKVAQKMEIGEVRLSKIVRQLVKPRSAEKEQLAKILGKKEVELFS